MRSLGFALLDWIETYLIHGPGDIEGQAIALDDEFASFILRCYEVDADGKRAIRRAVISRPKGRAKSELAAFLAVAEAIGPVRFSHFAKAGECLPGATPMTRVSLSASLSRALRCCALLPSTGKQATPTTRCGSSVQAQRSCALITLALTLA